MRTEQILKTEERPEKWHHKIADWWDDKKKQLSDRRYEYAKNHKWFKWIDDNIVWYVWDKPRDWYRTVRHWFVCNFNRYHWRLLKAAWTSYPWDGGFILYLEECQIDKQLHWFEHHQQMIDEQYNEIMRTLRWAKYCIHVLNNETDLFHYDGEMKFEPIEDVGETPDGHKLGLSRLNMDDMVYCYDGPRVNRRNARRFLNKSFVENERFKEGHWDHELYMAKCRHIYYMVRERFTDYWWD